MKPILFNAEMVNAILEGMKTTTRMAIKPSYKQDESGFQVCTNKSTGERWVEKSDLGEGSFDNPRYVHAPYQVGDILYVKETWRRYMKSDNCYLEGFYVYKADESKPDNPSEYYGRWRSPIHMTRYQARIFLKVISVRIERLQDITEEQAEKEGVGDLFLSYISNWPGDKYKVPMERKTLNIEQFELLWDSTIKKQDLDKYGWEANPWVWIYKFERVGEDPKKPIETFCDHWEEHQKEGYSYDCPTCGEKDVGRDSMGDDSWVFQQERCWECGQKLDWGSSND